MRTEIIAELAQGFEGEPLLARLLVRAAVHAGVDAVKLQLIYADEIASPGYRHYDLYRRLEMPFEVWQQLRDEAAAVGLRFYLDISGDRSLREARTLSVDGVKISTSNFFNASLVDESLRSFTRVFVGVGGITVEEIEQFVARHKIVPGGPVCFLYGLQTEPTPTGATNLLKLAALKQRFPGQTFGYMDHAEGGTEDADTLALLALPLGIACVEKHLSLDRVLQLEDFVSALDPDEMRAFVARVRRMEAALGSGSLDLSAEEMRYRTTKLKIVVADRDLAAGATVGAGDVQLKRIASHAGAVCHLAADVVGKRLRKPVVAGSAITSDLLV